jgi:hypothetical protein
MHKPPAFFTRAQAVHRPLRAHQRATVRLTNGPVRAPGRRYAGGCTRGVRVSAAEIPLLVSCNERSVMQS